jgi:hypothetical protein
MSTEKKGNIYLRDAFSVFPVDWRSVFLPEFEREVLKLRILKSTLVEMS